MCGTVIALRTSRCQRRDRVLSIVTETHLFGQVTEQDLASDLGLPLPGVLTDYRIFPGTRLVAAPSHLSDGKASTLPTAAVIAWMSLNGFQPIGQPIRDMDLQDNRRRTNCGSADR